MKKDILVGKYIISLNNFSPENTLKKLGVWSSESTDYEMIKEDIYDENVLDIMQDKSDRHKLFIDSKKIKHKVWVQMIDFSRDGPLLSTTSKPCWWCRETFVTCPLGIPIFHWNKDSISVHKDALIEKCKKMNISIDENYDFFETEGIVCSFPCMKAYIIDNLQNPRYKQSLTLMQLLFRTIHKSVRNIPISPSWKTLEKWGGNLTIEQYRSSFDKLVYDETINMLRPIMFPVSGMYEEEKS